MCRRILLIVPPERFDFYNYLNRAENVEWILLWNEKPSQMQLSLDDLPLKFQKVIFWKHFDTPSRLIKVIQPDKIVLFEIIDLRQIALIIEARAKGIPTIYLGHGASGDRETSISRWKEITFIKNKLPYLFKRLSNSFFDVLSSKLFYYSVFKGFTSFKTYISYLFLPVKMLFGAPSKVIAYNKFRERVPLKSIVFNLAAFEEYKIYTGIPEEEIYFTGVPYFDSYFTATSVSSEHIVYIDHPYLELNIVGWTPEHHKRVAECIFNFAEKNRVTIYIKLHPRSNRDLWESYGYNKSYVKIIQTGNFTNIYLESKLIIGYSSSLMPGFLCAKKNVVLLGWHPEPHIFGADFSESGLCHVSFSPDDLIKCYETWISNNLTIRNESKYQEFLRRFNYPFDGQATQRVLNVIESA
jgi:hypothetical protein